jgi:two-component system, NtrC family, sensor kinase
MDFFQIAIKVGIVALIAQVFRKLLETNLKKPEIDKYLKYAWVGAIIINTTISFFAEKESDKIFYYFLFSFIIFITYKIDDPKISRTLLIAILPIFLASALNSITEILAPNIHKNYNNDLETFYDFTLFWLFGFSIYAHRQNKKDRILRQKEQEEHEKLLAQKNTLEHQVAERTAEILKQKNSLEQTVLELKSTQNQLIQAEKMASLGELTAGIAHEIQNPLNFVNNFSEVSVELCNELIEHLDKETFDKNFIKETINDLTQNQQKITHHGQRAASIVKGMLLHSRNYPGVKELTDVNALADEYLRLSYHGLRAKDKSFNANFKTEFDPNLPKILIVPQDMGRVFLNLINNAFYAVSNNDADAKPPIINISTQQSDNQIIIEIKDNGKGMSNEVKSKIFQPFFTTKPTGQGTGLGLSLAYDIVTKGHGGTIDCKSTENTGTVFSIKLPIS